MNLENIIILAMTGVIIVLGVAYILVTSNKTTSSVEAVAAVYEPHQPAVVLLEDLELRANGLYYKKFSNPTFTPYTGPVTIIRKGHIDNGVLVEFDLRPLLEN